MNSLKGCTALITGASSGLGAELARQLAAQAGCLMLVARRMDRLEVLRDQLARPGLKIYCLEADLSQEASTEELLGKIAESGEAVDFLVNNAGLGDHGLFESSDWARVKAMLDVNITALTRLTRALVPSLVSRGRGAVLNVSSIASLIPMPEMAVYGATKAYVTSFSEALRSELRGTGVSVTALCPGPVDTEFFVSAERGNGASSIHTPEFFKVSATQVVSEALRAVTSDRPRVIPGLLVCLIMTVVAALPLFLVRNLGPGSRARR